MSDAEDTYRYGYRSGQRTYDWIEVRGIEHTWMVELGQARKLAMRLEGRVAELEAALEQIRDCQPEHWFDDGNTGIHYTTGLGFVQTIAEDALAGSRGDQTAPLQAQVARLRAALEEQRELWLLAKPDLDTLDRSRFQVLFTECHAPIEHIDAALAGTGDEVGAVVRAAVRYWQQAGQAGGQAERYNALVTLMDKVADLLAKQPGVWERD